VGHAIALEAAYVGQDLVERRLANRLGEDQRSRILDVAPGRLVGRPTGEEYEAVAQLRVVFTDGPVDLYAVDAGHRQIAEDQVHGLSGLELSERLVPAARTRDIVTTHTAEVTGEGFQQKRLVVDQQDAHLRIRGGELLPIGMPESDLWSISQLGSAKSSPLATAGP